jgi:mannose-6-phosphate isomerase-like protein (cupin superfamily)
MRAPGHTRSRTESASIAPISDPRTAPYGSVRLADVDTLAEVDPGNPEINPGAFHLIRRHFDVQAFGVNAVTGDAGDEFIEEHHEADDEENKTNGHQELFAVIAGHALFTVDGEEIDAPAGTIVFVRDPALLRAARATADGTTVLAIGGPAGVPYAVSRWETELP